MKDHWRLAIRQHGKIVAEWPRSTTGKEDVPEITEEDTAWCEQRAAELHAKGDLETGYYDVLIFKGSREVDGSIGVA